MNDYRLPCPRCGNDMKLHDPAPGAPWRPDQYWVCARCGRHFWTTYPTPPAAPPKPTTGATAAL